ncbi:MAG: hypothetical protein WA129_00030, partial [Acidovorax sp.]
AASTTNGRNLNGNPACSQLCLTGLAHTAEWRQPAATQQKNVAFVASQTQQTHKLRLPWHLRQAAKEASSLI